MDKINYKIKTDKVNYLLHDQVTKFKTIRDPLKETNGEMNFDGKNSRALQEEINSIENKELRKANISLMKV